MFLYFEARKILLRIYDIGYLAALPVAAPAILYKRFKKNKYKESLPGMFGKKLGEGIFGENPIWIHTVSVGEAVAGKSLVKPLMEKFNSRDIVVSTVTETGQQKAKSIFTQAKKVFYYPFDFSWNVSKFFDKIKPSMIIILETELWPNFLNIAGEKNIPVFLVNGKLSDKSYNSYLKLKFLFKKPLGNIKAFIMQTKSDADKMLSLVDDKEKIFVTGNVKFDSIAPAIIPDEREPFLISLGIRERKPIIVVGSTHPGEEEIFIDAYKKLKAKYPKMLMIIVPRHPERFDQTADMIAKSGIPFARYSKPDESPAEFGMMLVDKMGVLNKFYGVCDIAVVAGSFVPIGGHNLLEPAIYSVPVVTGPYTLSQKEIMRVMREDNSFVESTAENITDVLAGLIDNEARCKELGEKAKGSVLKNKGSAERSVEIIRSFF